MQKSKIFIGIVILLMASAVFSHEPEKTEQKIDEIQFSKSKQKYIEELIEQIEQSMGRELTEQDIKQLVSAEIIETFRGSIGLGYDDGSPYYSEPPTNDRIGDPCKIVDLPICDESDN